MRAIDLAQQVIARLNPVNENPEWIDVWWEQYGDVYSARGA